MKASVASSILAALAAPIATAHMLMSSPPSLGLPQNPNTAGSADYDLTSPLGSMANFPCNGKQSLLGTSEGASVASWPQGSQQTVTTKGGANHNGGSCQVSLSYDNGATWKVIHSYMGACPAAGETSSPFTVPADAPTGEALFGWSWVNKTGNREFYMNCAAVTITGGSAKLKAKRARAFDQRPSIFVANIKSDCSVAEGVDVEFPDPGDDVTVAPGANLSPPAGSGCGAVAAPPSNGGGDGSYSPAPAPTSSYGSPPPASSSTPAPITSSVTSPPGGVFAPSPNPDDSVPTPTTFVTATKSPEPPVSPPVATAPPVTSSPVNGGGEQTTGAQSGPCTEEGAWNCIGGTSFQRCASGAWSAAINMAPGTSCAPGVSSVISMSRRGIRGLSRRS